MLGRLLVVTGIFFLGSSFALAEGFYAGAGIGITQIEDSEDGLSFKDSPLGWRLLAGYDFNENFALEGSYANSGDAEDTVEGVDVKAELSAFTFSVVGLMPLSESTKLFGKLGYYDGEEEVSAFGLTVKEDADGLTAGFGVRYELQNNVAIRGDFDWYDSDLDTLWSVGVGFQVLFGK